MMDQLMAVWMVDLMADKLVDLMVFELAVSLVELSVKKKEI